MGLCKTTAVVMAVSLFVSCLSAQGLFLTDIDRSDWWNEPYNPNENKLSESTTSGHISVNGNKFVNEEGETVIFKGLSISDPDKIEKDGQWKRKHFEVIKDWGANVIRIPVHPVSLKQRGFKEYFVLLDQAVDWCTELGMKIIIDWHSIGNLNMEVFQADMYETSKKETYYFWKTVAAHYKGNTTVAFYEIFNEPTVYNGTLGSCTWEEWRDLSESIIDIIRAHDDQVVCLVGGFDWAYNLKPIEFNPIRRPNVGYVAHPYPGKCQPPRESSWEENFGFAADRFPILCTELGYYFEGEAHLIEDGTYREAIMDYFEKKGISWCAWVFDPKWVPQLISNYKYEPTHSGEFFRSQMREDK